MKKFLSHNDLIDTDKSKRKKMDSSDVREFNSYMKRVVRENSQNDRKANISASKVFLTR